MSSTSSTVRMGLRLTWKVVLSSDRIFKPCLFLPRNSKIEGLNN